MLTAGDYYRLMGKMENTEGAPLNKIEERLVRTLSKQDGRKLFFDEEEGNILSPYHESKVSDEDKTTLEYHGWEIKGEWIIPIDRDDLLPIAKQLKGKNTEEQQTAEEDPE